MDNNFYLITVRWPGNGVYETIAIDTTPSEWLIDNLDKESYLQPAIVFAMRINEVECNLMVEKGLVK